MATKNYMTLANLTTYDGLIKQYIGEEDAKSIKYISVDGNTVSFYKSETGSGTADYEITLPDVSNFIELIEDAGGDKVVVSNADGSVSESTIDADSLVTGYEGLWPSSGTPYLANVIGDHIVGPTEIEVSSIETALTTLSGLEDDVEQLQTDMSSAQDDITALQTSVATKVTGYGAMNTGYISAFVEGEDPSEHYLGATEIAVEDLSDLFDNVENLTDYVGEIPQSASATTVVDYVDEAVAAAVETVTEDSAVTISVAATPTTGYLKTYEFYQGGSGPDNLIGTVDIPKDLVVTSGEIVVNPTGQPAGTYLKLTIANQTEPVYINVADLCDVYTAAQSAAQVQLAISSTNEISATIVAGSVTATELASNAVTTAKIADDAVTADKVAISAHTEAQTAGADGVAISVTTTDGQVSAVSASIAANTYDAYGSASAAQTAAEGYTDSAIAGLDATASQTAGTDGLALSITEVDGKVTAISGSIAANTYDASGAAATAKSEVIGTSSDAASANTVYGAKAYADAATDAIATADIQALFA